MWEITGAEFSKSTTHTADGISIRFPRVTRIRDDKDWKTANDLSHLKVFDLDLFLWCFFIQLSLLFSSHVVIVHFYTGVVRELESFNQ